MNFVCLNSNGNVFLFKVGEELVVMGSFIEVVILMWGLKLGMDFYVVWYENEVLYVEIFNFEKKCVGVVYKNVNDEVEVYWKGVVEIIFDFCI